MTAALEVSDLSVGLRRGRDQVPVLHEVSLRVETGEAVALVGPSGSGKSTLALAVLDLLPAGATVTGSVHVTGEPMLGRTDAELCAIRGARVSLVLQDPASALDPVRTIERQVAAAVTAHAPLAGDALRARVHELLASVALDDVSRVAGSLPHRLSGGQRQRVAVAIALAHDPDLVIADEPTTALDVTAAAHVLDALVHARRTSGGALLLITHDLDVAAARTDRIVALRDGRVAERADDQAPLPPRTPRPPRPPVLVASALAKRAVRDVSLALAPGRTVGLVGPSGSGKTTIARLLVGLDEPDAGTLDRPRDTGIVFQDPRRSLDPRWRVRSVVAEPLRIAGIDPTTIDARVLGALADVGLDASFADRYPHQLSLGEAQRVAVARAVVARPSVVVLDEPVSSLDAATRAGVLQLLLDLQDEHDLAYLFVSHDPAVIAQMADEVVALP